MSIAECYVLDVQCDYCPDTSVPRRDQFTGPTPGAAHKARREAGWQIYPAQRKAKCPACVERGKRAD